MQTITATIESVTRGKNTKNGNPNLTVEVLTSSEPYPGRATFKVRNDSFLASRIVNGEFDDGEPRVFALTRSGRLDFEVV
ncbi:hypothetical protein SEA_PAULODIABOLI_390 [Microbacterium phage PauloDiaboli]|nr:hypothetical protein SEA_PAULODIABOLI_35 [Microbacterium phage PauloDiaboli]QIG58071.1 hypothetical protein SEA_PAULODIABOLI_390 [Microbacterium phage PauloDiaboli]